MVLPKSNKLGYLAGAIALILSIWACSTVDAFMPSLNYFPIKNNQNAIFSVSEIQFRNGDTLSKRQYFIKETTINTSESEYNNYKIEKYLSQFPDKNWKLDSIYTGRKSLSESILTINNIEFLKQKSPLGLGSTWNVNTYNTLKAKNASISGLNLTYGKYKNVIEISIQRDSSLINLNKEIELYAPDIGLVKREFKQIQYCQKTPDCIGKNKIESGVIIEKKLINNY